jgi:hypothetical protein
VRKIELERRAWTKRGHWFGLFFALSLPTGLWASDAAGLDAGKPMLGWATICLGVAIFCWYKGSE